MAVYSLVAPTRDISGIKNWRPILWKAPSHREHCWLWCLWLWCLWLLCLFLLLSLCPCVLVSWFLLLSSPLFFLLIDLLVDCSSFWLFFLLLFLSLPLLLLLLMMLMLLPNSSLKKIYMEPNMEPHISAVSKKIGLQPSPYQMLATKPGCMGDFTSMSG